MARYRHAHMANTHKNTTSALLNESLKAVLYISTLIVIQVLASG
jgi:hypothetical protein